MQEGKMTQPRTARLRHLGADKGRERKKKLLPRDRQQLKGTQ